MVRGPKDLRGPVRYRPSLRGRERRVRVLSAVTNPAVSIVTGAWLLDAAQYRVPEMQHRPTLPPLSPGGLQRVARGRLATNLSHVSWLYNDTCSSHLMRTLCM